MSYLVYAIVFLLPLIFLAPLNSDYELLKLVFFRMMTLMLLFAFTIRLLCKGRMGIFSIFKDRGFKKMIFLFLTVLAAGLIFSIAPAQSFWGSYYRMQGVYTLLHYFLFFLLLCTSLHERRQWETALKFMFGGFAAVLLYGIFQWLDGGLMAVSLGRVFSTLAHPSYLASYIVLLIFLVPAVFKKKRTITLVLLAALALLFLTKSRGAFIGLLVGVSCYTLLWKRRKRRRGLIFAVVILSFAVVAATIGIFAAGLGGASLRSVEYRLVLWKDSLRTINESPIFGYGIESFPLAIQKHASADLLSLELFNSLPDRAFNTFLEIAANVGIFGVVVFMLIFVNIFRLGVAALKRAPPERVRPIIGILSGFAALFVAHMFSFSVTVHFVMVSFLLAYLLFLVSRGVVRKKIRMPKFYKVAVGIFITIFVVSSIVLQNLFPLVADYHTARAFEALDENDANTLVRNLQVANLLMPNQSYYNYLLASVYHQLDEKELALDYLDRAGKFNNYRDAFYYLLLGKILAGNDAVDDSVGDPHQAEQAFLKSYALSPTYPSLLLSWGIFYIENGDCGKGVARLEEYLNLAPESWKKTGTEDQRLFYKHNPDFDDVFGFLEKCDQSRS